MHVHQLQHLALGNHVGCFGEDFHDAHTPGFHHHLKGAGVQKISHQYAGRVSEGFIGGGASATKCRCIDHVVVEQSRRMNQFDHSSKAEVMRSTISECSAHHQQQRGPQAFAAGRDDVLRYLCHQGDTGGQSLTNDLVDLLHVLCNEREGGCCGGGMVGQDGGRRKCPDYRKTKVRSSRAQSPRRGAWGLGGALEGNALQCWALRKFVCRTHIKRSTCTRS